MSASTWRGRRCDYCGEPVVYRTVWMGGGSLRHMRQRLVPIDPRPHALGTVVDTERGLTALRKGRLPSASTPAYRVHGPTPCAAIGDVDLRPQFRPDERPTYELIRAALLKATEHDHHARV